MAAPETICSECGGSGYVVEQVLGRAARARRCTCQTACPRCNETGYVLVPSGGSKWVIEAPYVMAAAHTLHVHLGWIVTSYDLGEALANLVQPFWMLPILGLFRLNARDVMGYTTVVFLVLTPMVVALVLLLGLTLRYPL